MPDIPETNLVLWLKADAIVGLSDGDKVATWEDSSSAGNDATQATESAKPIYRVGVRHVRPALEFDGARELATANALFTGSGSRSIYVVYQHTVPADFVHVLCGQSGSSGSYQWFRIESRNHNGESGDPFIVTYGGDMTGPTPDTDWKIAHVTYDGSAVRSYKNNVSANQAVLALNTNDAPFVIGHGGSGEWLVGYIAEIIVYSSVLSSGDNTTVYDYLTAKYSPVEVEDEITDAASIADEIDGDSPYRDISESLSIDDAIDGINLTDGFTEDASLADSIDSFSLTDIIVDAVALNDTPAVSVDYDEPVTDAATIADALSGAGSTYYIEPSDSATIADAISVFDWTAFIAQYEDQVVTRYYFTLTGDADGVADAVIPISSFSYRRRDGDESYLSVVIPSMDYSSTVTARANGDMKLEMAYLVANVEVLRETIIVVDLESVRTDEGANNQSITLSGHRDENFGGQICTPRGINYKSCTDGKWLIRCLPDPYLRPGDTIRVDGVDLFDADYVSAYASGSYASMEVSES